MSRRRRSPRPTLRELKIMAAAEAELMSDMVRGAPDAHGGTGLFAVRDIAPRELALVYMGQVITENQLYHRYPDGNPIYVMATHTGRYVDAAKVLSLAARINHASRRPNSRFTLSDSYFPTLTNTRAIKAGAEVRANYGKEYFISEDGTSANRGFEY